MLPFKLNKTALLSTDFNHGEHAMTNDQLTSDSRNGGTSNDQLVQMNKNEC